MMSLINMHSISLLNSKCNKISMVIAYFGGLLLHPIFFSFSNLSKMGTKDSSRVLSNSNSNYQSIPNPLFSTNYLISAVLQ